LEFYWFSEMFGWKLDRLNKAKDRTNATFIMYIDISSHTHHTPGNRLLSGNHFRPRIYVIIRTIYKKNNINTNQVSWGRRSPPYYIKNIDGPPYPRVTRSKTYRCYLKPLIIPHAIYNVILRDIRVTYINTVKFNW